MLRAKYLNSAAYKKAVPWQALFQSAQVLPHCMAMAWTLFV